MTNFSPLSGEGSSLTPAPVEAGLPSADPSRIASFSIAATSAQEQPSLDVMLLNKITADIQAAEGGAQAAALKLVRLGIIRPDVHTDLSSKGTWSTDIMIAPPESVDTGEKPDDTSKSLTSLQVIRLGRLTDTLDVQSVIVRAIPGVMTDLFLNPQTDFKPEEMYDTPSLDAHIRLNSQGVVTRYGATRGQGYMYYDDPGLVSVDVEAFLLRIEQSAAAQS